MRMAIHNAFYGRQLAEAELSRRLILAAQKLGWDALEVGSAAAIWQYRPDWVLNLHFRTPKLTSYPTYGCLWHPLVFMETDDIFIRNILSYDAYLSSSFQIDQWLANRLYNTPKNYFVAPFFTSCNTTNYQPPNLEHPRLMYVGTNWDGERHKALLLALTNEGFLELYGSSSWSSFSSYKGALPFDGISLLTTLNQCGVGLCLHRKEHTQEGIPSMRIFEIVASGAIAICSDHAFIRAAFADTVLYIDANSNASDQVAQISHHIAWVQAHPAIALEMSRAAHQIFVEQFSLETLLLNLQPHHQQLIQAKGLMTHPAPTYQSESPHNSVQLILRSNCSEPEQLRRSLESIQAQTHSDVSVLFMQEKSSPELHAVLETYQPQLSIQVLECPPNSCRSSSLWLGIQAISAPYFGILESGTTIYPNHLSTLVSILNQFPTLGMAYSEVIQTGLQSNLQAQVVDPNEVIDTVALAPMPLSEWADLFPLHRFICINNVLARSTLLDQWLQRDPKLERLEDVFLLLNLGARGCGMFSYEATCEIETGLSPVDRLLIAESWNRIQIMMRDREFPTSNTPFSDMNLRRRRLQETQAQLQQAQQRIAAMESSKFWQLRQRWMQLKRKLGWTSEV